MNVARDLRPVAELIAEAFKDDMDPNGERSIREMKTMGRWAWLYGWLDALAPPGEGMAPGFVWVEDGRIVGNASIRRISLHRRGWLIGNVAVDPAWRRRGIARALMHAAIDMARRNRADWIVLQVRSDSVAARDLYLSMNFQTLGETIQYRRTRYVAVPQAQSPVEGQLRRARSSDMDFIYALAQRAIPDELRLTEPLRRVDFSLGFESNLFNRLRGRASAWWVIDTGSGLRGAAHIEAPRAPDDGRLRLWLAPERSGFYEEPLLRAALTSIGQAAQRPIIASVTAQNEPARRALENAGFSVLRRLTHMRLDVR
jgi:ribosomal protein S18 acetylase RimI-like enzyme